MRVTKVERNGEEVKIEWEEKRPSGSWEGHGLISNERAMPKFYDALNNLTKPTGRILGMSQQWMMGAVAVGVRMHFSEKDDAKTVSVTLRRPIEEKYGGGCCKITTPRVVAEHFEPDLAKVEESATAFVRGERVQGTLFDDNSSGQAEEMLAQAKAVIMETQRASAGTLQRRLRIGHALAIQLLDRLESAGVIGPVKPDGGPRDILIGDGKPAPSASGEAPAAAGAEDASAATAADGKSKNRRGTKKNAA